jgi:hypothetical protein
VAVQVVLLILEITRVAAVQVDCVQLLLQQVVVGH